MQGKINDLLSQLHSRDPALRSTALNQIIFLCADQPFSDIPIPKPGMQSALGDREIFHALRSILASDYETNGNIATAAMAVSILVKNHKLNQNHVGSKTDIIQILISKLAKLKTHPAFSGLVAGLLQLIRAHEANSKIAVSTKVNGLNVFDILAGIMSDALASFEAKANALVLLNNLLMLPDSQKIVLAHPDLLKNACLLLKADPSIEKPKKIQAHVNEILFMLNKLTPHAASLFINMPVLEIFEAFKYKDPKLNYNFLMILAELINSALLRTRIAQSPVAISTLAALLKDYAKEADAVPQILRALYILRTLADTSSGDISVLSKNALLNNFIIEVLASSNISVKIFACNIIEQLALKDPDFLLSDTQMQIVVEALNSLLYFHVSGPRNHENTNQEQHSKLSALSLINALSFKHTDFLDARLTEQLITSLKSNHLEILYKTALAIENLTAFNTDYQARMLAHPEFINNVIAVLESSAHSEIKNQLILALECVAGENSDRQAAVLAKVDLKYFLNSLNSPELSNINSLRVLSLLTNGHPSTFTMIAANPSVQTKLLDAISDTHAEYADLQRNATFQLAQLAKNNPENQELLGKNPKIFKALVPVLKNHANYQAQGNALTALFELIKSHAENLKLAGESAGLMDSVADLFIHENPTVRSNAINCFVLLAKRRINLDQVSDLSALNEKIARLLNQESSISEQDKVLIGEIILDLAIYALEEETEHVQLSSPIIASPSLNSAERAMAAITFAPALNAGEHAQNNQEQTATVLPGKD
ncbi:MAG: hypothetical protein K0S29_202 [Gammaproteobacteria bacterium]|jgi:hypothetical protein|nr:hypothetical protein [Gammaproteobacteria bacterium]